MGILRLLLAVSVVLTHSSSIFGFSLLGGQIAVQAFYIISGFYMSFILNEKYVNQNNSYKLFITNRFLRLYPIYWCILILTVFYSIFISWYTNGSNEGAFAYYATYGDTMNLPSWFFLAFTNVFLFFQDLVMFLGLDTTSGNLFFTKNFQNTSPQLYGFLFIQQAWTIGLELTFYLIAPFVVRRGVKTIAVLIAGSLLLRVILYKAGLSHDPWTYRFFPTELVFFLLGSISYAIFKKIRNVQIKPLYLNLAFAFCILFTLVFNFLPIPYKAYIYFISIFTLLPFLFYKTKNSKIDSFIGDLSYPIYLCHIFILTILHDFKITGFMGGMGLTLVILSIAFSIVLNELVAKKIEFFRQRRIKNVKVTKTEKVYESANT